MDEWLPLVDGGQPVLRRALDNVLSLDEEHRIDQHDEPIGALSGFVGGRTDLALTRFIDVMYAFPRLLFVILVMSMLGAGLTTDWAGVKVGVGDRVYWTPASGDLKPGAETQPWPPRETCPPQMRQTGLACDWLDSSR